MGQLYWEPASTAYSENFASKSPCHCLSWAVLLPVIARVAPLMPTLVRFLFLCVWQREGRFSIPAVGS